MQDSELVGVWEGTHQVEKDNTVSLDRMYVEFTAEGYVAFHRVSCWADAGDAPDVWKVKNFNIDFMPVIKLNQEKAKAQWMPFTPTIELSLDQWPEQTSQGREMVVDGMRLTQVKQASDRTQWTCEQLFTTPR